MSNLNPSKRRWKSAVVILAIALIVVVGLTLYRATLGYWSRLEAAARLIGTPAKMEKLFEAREGTTLCFFSCDDARLIVAFRTQLSRGEACDSARATIDEHFATTPVDVGSDLTCKFLARLPSVGGAARLNVAVLTPSQLRSRIDYQPWLDEVPDLASNESIVTVRMFAGID